MRRSSAVPGSSERPAVAGEPPGRRLPDADPGPAPAWQTYPDGSDRSTVQDPVSPELPEAAAHADFLAAADPVGLYTEAAPVKAAAAPSRRTQARRCRHAGCGSRRCWCSAWCCSVWPSPTRWGRPSLR